MPCSHGVHTSGGEADTGLKGRQPEHPQLPRVERSCRCHRHARPRRAIRRVETASPMSVSVTPQISQLGVKSGVRMWPRSRRCVCRPADKAAPAPTAPQAGAERAAYRQRSLHTREGPAAGPVLLASYGRRPVPWCGHVPADTPADVPALGAVLFPHAVHAPARVRAALPGAHAGLPGRGSPLRRRADRARLGGRRWRPAQRPRHPRRDHPGRRAARWTLGPGGAGRSA